MKKEQITIGGTYMAKVSDKVVPVRIDGDHSGGGGWDATNLVTNKKVRIKSAQGLRGPAPDPRNSEHGRADNQAPRASSDATVKTKKTPKTKTPKEKKPSGLDAAAQVLKDAGEPMRCKDMVEKMISDGLWKTGGKTPSATIYSAILREIQTKGSESRFKKTDRGLFTTNTK